MTSREYLFHLEQHGIKLGLDNIRRLLLAAGNPHEKAPCVHIAGTNGKGSVAAMVDAIARAAGYRTGRFTSPHLIDITERFLVDRRPISAARLDEAVAFFRPIAEGLETPPTFFEMTTAMAFRWFAQEQADLAIVEVGMGGRLDSTNVVSPEVSVITTIGLDHTQYLGDTLEKIAFEKAGILKPGVPAVLAEQHEPARGVLLARAAEVGAPVSLLGRDFTFSVTGAPFEQRLHYRGGSMELDRVPLALSGAHQGQNAAAAVTAACHLRTRFPGIDRDSIAEGLRIAKWPCRMERVLETPPVIMDVAHNPEGASVLARELARTGRRYVTLLAVSSDKDAAGMASHLIPITSTFVLSQFSGARAMPVDRLAEVVSGCPCHPEPDLARAIDLALSMASAETPLLITGSIFTAGEARRLLMQRHQAAALVF